MITFYHQGFHFYAGDIWSQSLTSDKRNKLEPNIFPSFEVTTWKKNYHSSEIWILCLLLLVADIPQIPLKGLEMKYHY